MAHFAIWAIWATWTNNKRRERGSKMIENLKKIQTRFGYLSGSSPLDMLDKINELVDAVNEQQLRLNNIMCWLAAQEHKEKPAEEPAEEPADHYEEQTKWIGKLCRFWENNEKEDARIGILSDIITSGRYLPKNATCSFENCEPVSPDDDIIYKKD